MLTSALRPQCHYGLRITVNWEYWDRFVENVLDMKSSVELNASFLCQILVHFTTTGTNMRRIRMVEDYQTVLVWHLF